MKNKFPRGIELCAGAIIENSNKEILLAKSPKWNNKWTFPSGHIELGEKIEEGAIREIEEEVGLKLKSEGIFTYGELIDSKDFHRPAHFVYFDIYCKTDDIDVKIDEDELTEYKWMTPQTALEMDLAESYDKAINDFINFKKNNFVC